MRSAALKQGLSLKLVAATLGLSALILCEPSFAQQNKNTKSAPPITSLEKDLQKLQRKSDSARQQLRQTKRQVRKVSGDIQAIDNRLSKLEDDLEVTTNRLSKSISLQKETASALEHATQTLAKTKEQVQRRLRWMYMHGQSHVADVLMGSQSFGDFASRTYLLQRVAHADRELFTRFKAERAEVASKKVRIDNLVREIKGLENSQKQQQNQLSETKSEKRAVLSELRDRQEDLEKLVRQLDAEENAIQSRIAAYYRAQRPGTALPKFTGRFMKPVAARITSGYGNRFHPILKRNRLHAGIDFGAPTGTPIKAAAAGRVIVSTYMRGYGNTVIIDHGGGYSTLYGHCSRVFVKSGQSVIQGQRIAAVGSTGLSTGPHLHFEIRINGKAVNPAKYL